jgi:F-type H+-transporting ATPase subunit epsilon
VALHLEIVTPRGSVVDIQAEEVVLPGLEGEFGVLDGHIPFLSALRPGVVRYTDQRGTHRLAIGTGFSEVGAGDRVSVLTDEHALPDQIDLDQTRAELAELEGRLKAWTGELTGEHKELQERAQWAQARIDTLEGGD